MPKLSILIVNYNGLRFLRDCLDSISQFVTVSHEVIVVDNASQDGSVEFIQKNYPSVRLIESKKNLGFGGGNNVAAKAATGEYLLLLNNDTVLRAPVLLLLQIMDREKSVGLLGCRLLYGDGKQQESVGYFPSITSLAMSWLPLSKKFPDCKWIRRNVPAKAKLYEAKKADVDWVSGAFMMVRRALWNQLAGMDQAYFMYMEDTDFCKRVRAMNYKVVYSSECEVTHFEGSGKPWIGEAAVMNSVRSYVIYIKKFHGSHAVFFFRVLLAPVFFLRCFCHGLMRLFLFDRYGLEKFRVYGKAVIELVLGKQ